jgi:hypothetical protein
MLPAENIHEAYRVLNETILETNGLITEASQRILALEDYVTEAGFNLVRYGMNIVVNGPEAIHVCSSPAFLDVIRPDLIAIENYINQINGLEERLLRMEMEFLNIQGNEYYDVHRNIARLSAR